MIRNFFPWLAVRLRPETLRVEQTVLSKFGDKILLFYWLGPKV